MAKSKRQNLLERIAISEGLVDQHECVLTEARDALEEYDTLLIQEAAEEGYIAFWNRVKEFLREEQRPEVVVFDDDDFKDACTHIVEAWYQRNRPQHEGESEEPRS